MPKLHCGAREAKENYTLLYKKPINSGRDLSCVLWNACSLQHKLDDFTTLLEDENLDVAAVTETWLTSQHNNTTAQLKEKGYQIHHFNREEKKGGGVALILKNQFKLLDSKTFTCETFECILVSTSCTSSRHLNFIVLYRYCELTPSRFLTEFYNFMDKIYTEFSNVIILGDFNLHVNVPSNPSISRFYDILDSFSLNQLVQGPTHKLGNTLDLVLVNASDILIKDLRVDFNNRSDHAYVFFKVTHDTELKSKKTVLIKDFKGVNMQDFRGDIAHKVDNYVSNVDSVDFYHAVSKFNNLCTECVQEHVETKVVTISENSKPKWMDSEFVKMRARRRKLYKRWKRTRLDIDRINFENARQETHTSSVEKRSKFYATSINNCNNSHKELFKICKSLLDKSKSTKLPTFTNPESMATVFNNYFIKKIVDIRSSFPSEKVDPGYGNGMDTYNGLIMSEFKFISQDELKKIILSKPIKTSPEDPLPAILFKACVDELLPALSHLVNLSLSTGSMDGLKDTVITPILKKAGLDPEEFKNYRPVFNVLYLSKLIERAVLAQSTAHILLIKANIPNQSGYKPKHSCETLLIRVTNDILINSDNSKITIMLLLDLSAAFDTVDHDVLLDILWFELGFRGKVYNWFVEFLKNRKQAVNIEGQKSSFRDTKYGVPQGSVIGPFLFNIYVRHLIKVMEEQGFTIHGYADDHQLLYSFQIDFQVAVIRRKIPECLDFISNWMARNFLKLNPTKSQVIVFYPKPSSDHIAFGKIMLSDGTYIDISSVAYNLGVQFDSLLTYSPHITSTVAEGYTLIRNIASIRRYLSIEHLKTLVNAIVIAKVDHCNCLLYGISAYDSNRLQMFQNSCARLIYRKKKYDHVSGLLRELHWLPSEARIHFKILCHVFKCIHNLSPVYLSELIIIRRTQNLTLNVPRSRSQMGDRAFSISGPKLWNALPVNIRMIDTLENFKSKLKHLFFNNFNEYKMKINIYRS